MLTLAEPKAGRMHAEWAAEPTVAGDGATWDATVRFGRNVVLGDGVRICPGAVIYDNVEVGPGSFIGANVVLGEPLRTFYRTDDYENPPLHMGENSVIRTGSIIYAGSTFGPNLETGAYATVREQTQAGRNCLFGSFADIQGTCEIGDYARFHSHVTIGMHARIGKYVWMHPYVILLNDPMPPIALNMAGPSIGDYAVLAANCMVFPGVKVGRHAVIGAGSVLREDVPDRAMANGSPARVACDARRFVGILDGRPIHPYPWPRHRDGGFPWEGQTWRDDDHV